MQLQFWSIGKKNEPYANEGIDLFTKRISHYYKVEWKIISSLKNAATLNASELKKKEGEQVLQQLGKDDTLIALEERGKQLSSEGLANLIQKKANEGCRNLIFLIGGAYGLDEAVLQRANFIWSLSQLVFPHQLVRIILAEQVYRASTINKNEKYHHS